jgi:hypothetical protein
MHLIETFCYRSTILRPGDWKRTNATNKQRQYLQSTPQATVKLQYRIFNQQDVHSPPTPTVDEGTPHH